MAPRVDVGVVTWNTAELTVGALRSLLDHDQGCDLRVLVHDNASHDGTPQRIAEAVPEADVVAGNANLGFAGGMNRLLARSDAPWFFALNSDAWPEPGTLARLVEQAERHPRTAAVAPLLLRPDGSVEHSTHPFPSLSTALLDAVGGRAWLPRRHLERLGLEGAWRHDRPRPVDWAVGAALLLRRPAVEEVGGFDERFFMYVEDLEWCWRARRRGWEVRFEPSAVVRHVGNASGVRRFGEHRDSVDVANQHRFLRQTRGPSVTGLYRALTAVAGTERYALARLHGDHEGAEHWRRHVRAHAGRQATGPAAPWPSSDVEAPPDGAPRQEPSAAHEPHVADPPPGEEHMAAPHDGGPHDGQRPAVSVVVATRGRGSLLPRLVAAVEAQRVPGGVELVVVDDGSPDDSAEILDKLAADAPFPVQVVHLPHRRGPARARNVGWRHARAPVIAFTDDDCVPCPGWAAAGLAALDGRRRLVVGRTDPPPDQLEAAARPFARVLMVHEARYYETCNVFYRRRDLEAVDGFDERFGWGGEDTDLGLRAVVAGVAPVFAADAQVHHDVSAAGLRGAVRDATRYVDIPRVLHHHPGARRTLVHRWLFWKRTHPPAIAAGVGVAWALAGRRPWALVLALPWVHHRLRVTPACPGPLRRVTALPGALVVDLVEVGVMVRGSVRHRTVLL